jgi:hypothetical protein
MHTEGECNLYHFVPKVVLSFASRACGRIYFFDETIGLPIAAKWDITDR